MMKYGRKQARYTVGSFQRSHILRTHLSALNAPPAVSPDWVSAVEKQSSGGWLMDGNDNYGDCCFADCAHQEMLRTANVGTIWIPTVAETLALYSAVTGFNPDDPSTDQGADELTVINYLIKTGWLGRKLDASANLDPTQLDQLKWAVCIFGASRLGLNLPDSAQSQFETGQPWAPVPGAQLDGGHDVPIVKYDGTYFYVVTWGKLQPVDPSFLTAKYDDGTPYLEEAHAELAFDWISQAGACPAKLDLTQLVADLKAIVEPPAPAPQPPPVPSPPGPPPPPTRMSKDELRYQIINAAWSDDIASFMDLDAMIADLASILKEASKP